MTSRRSRAHRRKGRSDAAIAHRPRERIRGIEGWTTDTRVEDRVDADGCRGDGHPGAPFRGRSRPPGRVSMLVSRRRPVALDPPRICAELPPSATKWHLNLPPQRHRRCAHQPCATNWPAGNHPPTSTPTNPAPPAPRTQPRRVATTGTPQKHHAASQFRPWPIQPVPHSDIPTRRLCYPKPDYVTL